MRHFLRWLCICFALAALTASPQASAGDGFYRESLRVPFPLAGPRGLEALLIRPEGTRRYPLALISHGAPREVSQRADMTPNRFYAQAIEFARRGFAALVVMRRGYGDSAGEYSESNGPCSSPDYLVSGKASAEDLRAAIDAMKGRSDIATEGMIAVGQSAGGFATVALTANPPPGLVAAISFAGGRGSPANGKVCDEAQLIETFGKFGQTSRIPMLWVYAQNDQYFAPDLAHKFHAAFTAAGGKAQFIGAPSFGTDGHNLFPSGIDKWTSYVDAFLRERSLGSRDIIAAPPLPDIPPPPQLSSRNRESFTSYLKSGPHKAFAVSPSGAFSFRAGRNNIQDAKDEALKGCANFGPNCAIYAVDDALDGAAR